MIQRYTESQAKARLCPFSITEDGYCEGERCMGWLWLEEASTRYVGSVWSAEDKKPAVSEFKPPRGEGWSCEGKEPFFCATFSFLRGIPPHWCLVFERPIDLERLGCCGRSGARGSI